MADYNKDMFGEKRKLKGLTGAKRLKKYIQKDDIISELTKIEIAYNEDPIKGRKALAKFRRMFLINDNEQIEVIDDDVE